MLSLGRSLEVSRCVTWIRDALVSLSDLSVRLVCGAVDWPCRVCFSPFGHIIACYAGASSSKIRVFDAGRRVIFVWGDSCI